MSTNTQMKFTSALSTLGDTDEALAETIRAIKRKLDGAAPDVLFLFVSPHHKSRYEHIARIARAELSPRHVLGCSGGGVIGDGREAEQQAALSITAAVMPGVTLTPLRLNDEILPDLDTGPRAWETLVGIKPQPDLHFVVLVDPFSMRRADDLLAGLDFAYPQSVKIGGLASGATGPGRNALYLDDVVHHDGAVAMAFSGPVAVDTLVAQGCRPIGQPMQITQCHENVLLELDKRRPLDVLREIYEVSDERDQQLIRTALFVGIVMDPFKSEAPKAGDFLIRNLMGMDDKKGALAIATMLRRGQTLQFHLRDAAAASTDLSAVLRRYATESLNASMGESLLPSPRGALLFSCLGRGIHLYGEPDHDTKAFKSELGDVPLAGFFCNGEIGPVLGTTHIHGFTSCFGIFRPK